MDVIDQGRRGRVAENVDKCVAVGHGFQNAWHVFIIKYHDLRYVVKSIIDFFGLGGTIERIGICIKVFADVWTLKKYSAHLDSVNADFFFFIFFSTTFDTPLGKRVN